MTPQNIKEGLSSLEEKSVGDIRKSGTRAIQPGSRGRFRKEDAERTHRLCRRL
ncbi:MAG: hypothetical protein E3J66_03105 [Dehalococcoidia bacterium]|nr:MAG: hypothetical protein E3J66_03105 [Dehalococcoidia bacterium]